MTARDRDACSRPTDVVAGYLPGVDILHGCSLDVDDGEIVGIIGPNGAGQVDADQGDVRARAGARRLA